jgi:hypothetical protein
MKNLAVVFLLFLCISVRAQQQNTNELPVPKLVFDPKGELVITPSATSSKTDFDFFVGKWKLHNRILKKKPDNTIEWNEFEATQEMRTILDGIGNIDNYLAERNGKPFEGMTLRLFNPKTKLWSIYWTDSNSGVLGLPPVVGSFENKVGHFFSKDLYNGKTFFTVYRWDSRDPDKPVWSQATSEDNGKTWEWNWFMYMNKVL